MARKSKCLSGSSGMGSSAEEEVGAAKRKNRARVAREPQKTRNRRKGGWMGAEAISVSLCSLVEISVLIFNTNLAALVTTGAQRR